MIYWSIWDVTFTELSFVGLYVTGIMLPSWNFALVLATLIWYGTFHGLYFKITLSVSFQFNPSLWTGDSTSAMRGHHLNPQNAARSSCWSWCFCSKSCTGRSGFGVILWAATNITRTRCCGFSACFFFLNCSWDRTGYISSRRCMQSICSNPP